MHKTNDVAVDISHRVFYGIADPGLGGEVNDPLWFVVGKGRLDRLLVGKIDAQVGVVRVIGMTSQTSFFNGGVIIIVMVVNANDLVAAFKQAQSKSRADKASGPGD